MRTEFRRSPPALDPHSIEGPAIGGWKSTPAVATIRFMSRHQPSFKSTQIFDYESEPVDERPSEFGRSTGFSNSVMASGYHSMEEASARVRQRREHRTGMTKLLFIGASLIGACTVALVELANYVR
jgi:hypothetical protein